MMEALEITGTTILRPLDVLINPFGELFRIVHAYCKNNFIISEFDKPESEDEKASMMVLKETLIDKAWKKLDYNALMVFVFGKADK